MPYQFLLRSLSFSFPFDYTGKGGLRYEYFIKIFYARTQEPPGIRPPGIKGAASAAPFFFCLFSDTVQKAALLNNIL
jgi:hypothetical protein